MSSPPKAPPVTPEAILQVGLGFWALEDAAERDRARRVHRAGARARRRSTRFASGSACTRGRRATSSTRSWRSAFLERARRHATPTRRDDRPLPRPRQAVLRRRHARDGQRTASTRSGATSPRPCARASRRTRPRTGGKASSRRSTPTRRASKQFLAAMTGISHGANLAIAAQVPVERLQDLRRRRHGAGRPARRRSRWPTRTSPAVGFDLPEVGPIFEEYVARRRARRTACSSSPATSSTTRFPKADVVMMGHILHDWDLDEKKMLIAQGLRRPARRAARSSSTRRSSTTTARRTRSAC